MSGQERVYGLTSVNRISAFFLFAMFSVMGTALALFPGKAGGGVSGWMAVGGPFLVLNAVGIWSLLYALRARIILGPHQIRVRTAFAERTMRLDRVAGKRDVHFNSGARSGFRLISDTGQALVIYDTQFRTDDRFAAWRESLSDLDASDRQAVRTAIDRDARYGATTVEREARLSQAKRVVRMLWALSLLLTVWGVWYPHPALLLMTVAALWPWALLLMARISRGLIRFGGRPGADVRPVIDIMLFAPSVALGLLALRQVQVLEVKPVLVMGLAVAGITALAINLLAAERQPLTGARLGWLAIATIMLFGYGAGLVATTDVVMDSHRPQQIRTTALGGYYRGHYQPRVAVLLAPAGPYHHPWKVQVPWKLFWQMDVGSAVCVDIHQGAWNVPWIAVHHCPGSGHALHKGVQASASG